MKEDTPKGFLHGSKSKHEMHADYKGDDHEELHGSPERDRHLEHGEHCRYGRSGPRGEFPRDSRDRARRGEARFILLDALRDGPRHGYEIIKSIEERSAGEYVPSPGTVYPTLQLLEDQALVHADSKGERRVFALTDAGKTELAAREDEVKAFWSRFAISPAAAANRHEVSFLQESLDDLNRTIWRNLRVLMEQGDQAAIRLVRGSVEQCRNEVRHIIVNAVTTSKEPRRRREAGNPDNHA